MQAVNAITVADLRQIARRKLPKAVFDFIDGGAEEEITLRANMADFDAILLKQRILTNVAHTELGRDILGNAAAAPLMIGPTGLANLAYPHAEEVLAGEAAKAGIPFVLSTGSGSTLEEVASTGPGRRWFQLYVFKDRSVTEKLIARAQTSGYEALVITVDVPVVGKRRRDVRNGFTIPLRLNAASMLDFALHPGWCLNILRHGVPAPRNFIDVVGSASATSHAVFMNSQLDPSVDWQIIPWLRERWDGKILLKGVLSVEDATEAMAQDIDGIIVSNHGGRQLDSVASSIRMLSKIARHTDKSTPLFLDSGIRRGSDIVKAVALGAQAVLIGRPTLYAAAAGGPAGVRHCLNMLFDDMHRTLAQIGRASINDVDESCLEQL